MNSCILGFACFGIFLFEMGGGAGLAAAPTRHKSTGMFSLRRKEKKGNFQALTRTPTHSLAYVPLRWV